MYGNCVDVWKCGRVDEASPAPIDESEDFRLFFGDDTSRPLSTRTVEFRFVLLLSSLFRHPNLQEVSQGSISQTFVYNG